MGQCGDNALWKDLERRWENLQSQLSSKRWSSWVTVGTVRWADTAGRHGCTLGLHTTAWVSLKAASPQDVWGHILQASNLPQPMFKPHISDSTDIGLTELKWLKARVGWTWRQVGMALNWDVAMSYCASWTWIDDQGNLTDFWASPIWYCAKEWMS